MRGGAASGGRLTGAQFTGFTGKKVQILTQKVLLQGIEAQTLANVYLALEGTPHTSILVHMVGALRVEEVMW